MAALALTVAPAEAETLADAVALAYRTNPSITAGRYDVRAADEGVVQARSELRPTADVDVSTGYDRTVYGSGTIANDPLSDRSIGRTSTQARLSISQPVYTGGRATADRAVAEARVRTTREIVRATEGDLLLAVMTAYVDVRRYGVALGVWRASVVQLETLIREIEARQAAGEVTRTDVAQSKAQLQVARQQAALTEQSLEASRANYAALVGRGPAQLAVEPPLPQLPRDVDTAYDLAEGRSPELAQARFNELASRASVAAERATGRPTVSLQGTASLGGDDPSLRLRDQDRGLTGRVVLSVPLSAGGRVASLIRQAEDRNSGDRARIEAARRELARTLVNSWNAMVTATRTRDLVLEQRGFAETQLDGMIAEYRVGLRSTFDVLFAQQSLRDVQVALLSAEREIYVSQASVLRRTGLLEARAITTGIPLHDVTDHFRVVEHRNALPWDSAVAALDRIAKPKARQRALRQPLAPTRAPRFADPGPASVTPALVHDTPGVPAPATVGRPFTSQPAERR